MKTPPIKFVYTLPQFIPNGSDWNANKGKIPLFDGWITWKRMEPLPGIYMFAATYSPTFKLTCECDDRVFTDTESVVLFLKRN